MLVQVILAVGGSLYFSNFGDPMLGLFAGTGFNPCHLCWRGRILMYPLLPVVVYALLSKDDRLSFLTAFFELFWDAFGSLPLLDSAKDFAKCICLCSRE